MTKRSNSMRPYRVVLSRRVGGTEFVTLSPAGVGAERVPADMAADSITDAEIDDCLGELLPGMFEWERRRFADMINLMRVTVHSHQAGPKIEDAAIRKALTTILNRVPEMVAVEREYIELGSMPEYFVELRKEAAATMEKLVFSAQRAADLLGPQPESWKEAPWHADAYCIAAFLRQVGRRQGRSIKFSKGENDGPGLRAVTKALELARIPGIGNVTSSAVVKAISRKRRQTDVALGLVAGS